MSRGTTREARRQRRSVHRARSWMNQQRRKHFLVVDPPWPRLPKTEEERRRNLCATRGWHYPSVYWLRIIPWTDIRQALRRERTRRYPQGWGLLPVRDGVDRSYIRPGHTPVRDAGYWVRQAEILRRKIAERKRLILEGEREGWNEEDLGKLRRELRYLQDPNTKGDWSDY